MPKDIATKESLIALLPVDVEITDKSTSFNAEYREQTTDKYGEPVFAVSIECADEKESLDLLYATLKANDTGYDEVTRKTKWQ